MEIYGKNTHVSLDEFLRTFFLIVMTPQWNPNKTTVGRQGEKMEYISENIWGSEQKITKAFNVKVMIGIQREIIQNYFVFFFRGKKRIKRRKKKFSIKIESEHHQAM